MADDAAPIFLYTTSTGGQKVIHGNERATLLISGNGGRDRIQVVYLDIEQEKRQMVWEVSGKKGIYPLVFVGDNFIGDLDALEDLNEDGELKAIFTA